MGFPGLRQNVMLVRGEESLLRTEGEDKPRWSAMAEVLGLSLVVCCVQVGFRVCRQEARQGLY